MFKAIPICAAALSLVWLSTSAAATPEIFGTYNNGCIRGAVALKSGEHYQVQKWGPERNYGHPELIDYIHRLVDMAKAEGLPDLLIGDLSKPYGGPFGKGSSHSSHNIGLDVDISFDFATPKKSDYELSHPQDFYIVDRRNRPTELFTEQHYKLIYLATLDPRVERIFVAPGIKRELCALTEGQERSWLGKVRPWFAHRGHMHVRLGCPEGNPYCKVQKAPPPGDGCGAELMSWFEPPKPTGKTKPSKPKKKVLPEQCKLVLQGR
ncbi:MAG: penicillin-insensitive murein endopeptidase [Succinivibrio sp.]|nr:penicillin-insensitive murein endopeptidase [Succinivibrio sp.]